MRRTHRDLRHHPQTLEGKPAHRVTATITANIHATDTRFVLRNALLSARTYFDGDREEQDAALLQSDVRVTQSIFGRSLETFAFVENLFDAGDDRFVVRPRTFGLGAVGRY